MKVSVSIPTYNRADLLDVALESVFAQTYRNFEVVVVDDGSTDHTPEVVQAYGDRVRYFRQPNGGLGVARNAGLLRAAGDAIAFLDSDDYWCDFKLALQVALLDAMPHVSFLFSEFVILKDDGRRIREGSRTWLSRPADWSEIYERRQTAAEVGVRVPGAPADFTVYTGGLYRAMLREALVLPTTAIVRREAIGDLRFTEGMTIFEDWEFFARLARDHEGAFVDVETAVNRGHENPDRLTRCSALAKAECYLAMFDRVWNADAAFARAHAAEVRRAESDAVLALAREALLQGRDDVVAASLRRSADGPSARDRRRARAYRVLAALPGGRHLMRGGLLGRSLTRRLLRPARAAHPVNPSA